MVEQDGPSEIDRKILVTAMCLHCGQRFPDIATATTHDKTCPEHPVVRQLAKVMDAERHEQVRLIDERDAAVQQVSECEAHAREVTRLLAECVSEKADAVEKLAVAQAEIDRLTIREEQREISASVLSRIINTRLAEIRQLKGQLAVAKRFIGDMAKLAWESGTIDCCDFDEQATKAGILIETSYDPAIHGEQDAEVGDPWFVVAEAWRV